LLVFEVVVLKDVGSGADELEANALGAGLTRREYISRKHDDVVRIPVRGVVNDLIDTRLLYGFAGTERIAIRSAVSLPRATGALAALRANRARSWRNQ
jgi:hypothetical protein